MNSHLNIFNTYSQKNIDFQLENDLTRALAITLNEDSLFLNEFLKLIFNKTDTYEEIFGSTDSDISINIDVQKNIKQITGFEKIFAITLSESEMKDFWKQNYTDIKEPICDLVITINDVVVIIEVKRNDVDCTAQLYTQIFNLYRITYPEIELSKEDVDKSVFAVNLSWSMLMELAVKVLNFEKATIPNRFLNDFILLIRKHDFTWLPESSIYGIRSSNKRAILKRLETALTKYSSDKNNKLNYNDRMGLVFHQPWANELIFDIKNESGNLVVIIYPGNTKGQGYSLFGNDPKFNSNLSILGQLYDVSISYHMKFTSFRRFFTGIWFSESDLKKPLYTRENFYKYTGRKKRGDQWYGLSSLLDNSLNYDWKKQCNWDNLILKSDKKQFDISFGYEVSIEIPYEILRQIDKNQKDISGLVELISSIYTAFSEDLLISH